MARLAITLALLVLLVILVVAVSYDLQARRRRMRLERLRAAFVHGAEPLSPRPAAGAQMLSGAGLRLTLPARWKVDTGSVGTLAYCPGLAGGGRLTIRALSAQAEPGWGDEEPLSGGRALAKRMDPSPDAGRVVYAWRLRAPAARSYVARLDVQAADAGDVLVLDDVAAIELGLREAQIESGAAGAVKPAAS
jgi:hypothetical protein